MLRAHELLRRFVGLTTPGSLSGWVSPPATGLDPAASEDAAFADHSERQLLLTSRISAGLCLLVALLWWPVDLVIYRRDSGLHHPPMSFRIVICVLCSAYLLLPRRGLRRRLNYPLLVATLSALMAFIGYIAGELGGLDRP